MHVFITGWNAAADAQATAVDELRRITGIYPQLDPTTAWHHRTDAGPFAAGIHHGNDAIKPRRYRVANGQAVTFYDGVPIDPSGGLAAHDATALDAHWDQLAETLEGHYVAVRVGHDPVSLDLITDPLGLQQVYWSNKDGAWWVSNSLPLLRTVVDATAIDPLGASLFLTLGWAGGDRTLREGVHAIMGGQWWRWQQGRVEPRQISYFSPSDLAGRRKKPLTTRGTRLLANALGDQCRRLTTLGRPRCPITGGRDSRVLASLMMHHGIEADYFTWGTQGSADIRIGQAIAARFGLPHKVSYSHHDTVVEHWDESVERLLRQNDGMVSLHHVSHVVNQSATIDRLGVMFSGVEVARNIYRNRQLLDSNLDTAELRRIFVTTHANDRDRLIDRDAIDRVGAFLTRFFDERVAEGFEPIEVSDLFFAFERTRRWAGANYGKSQLTHDSLAPLCSRPFLVAAFGLPYEYRWNEHLHYRLIRWMAPQLHAMPFDKDPWPDQRVRLARWKRYWQPRLRRVRIRYPSVLGPGNGQPRPGKDDQRMGNWMYSERCEIMEHKLDPVRSFCLDHRESQLWQWINRDVFERATDRGVAALSQRRQLETLYQIATMFYLCHGLDRSPVAPTSPVRD